MKTKTVYPTIEISSPEEFESFRGQVHRYLHSGVVTVEFTKRDGTLRTMQCTLSNRIVPVKELETLHENSETPTNRKYNPEVRPVWDVEAAAWRSFLWNSIKSVTYNVE
jgi:hypothetical protein